MALPRGSKAPRVVEETRTKEHIDPIQAAEPDEREEIELEKDVRTEEPFGSETGSERGSQLGMDGGVENGMPGGLRGGMPGGVPDGTGTSPVFDYDAPPRVLRQTRPRYPQEAFVKKVERGHPVPAIAHAPVRFRIY